MKRDMDLVRAILLDIEATELPPDGGFIGFSAQGASPIEGYRDRHREPICRVASHSDLARS